MGKEWLGSTFQRELEPDDEEQFILDWMIAHAGDRSEELLADAAAEEFGCALGGTFLLRLAYEALGKN